MEDSGSKRREENAACRSGEVGRSTRTEIPGHALSLIQAMACLFTEGKTKPTSYRGLSQLWSLGLFELVAQFEAPTG